MALLLSAPRRSRGSHKPRASHLIPLLAAAVIAMPSITAVAYLLWPTWTPKAPDDNKRLPVSIGQTVFNVPERAFRVKVQRHSGPQERIDLSFLYPSLATPNAPRRVTAESAEDEPQALDRIFLSIAAHHDSLAPDALVRTIYPRYLDTARTQAEDGLSMHAFRDGTPYAGEDLFIAQTPALVTRCTREAMTPGMCLSERRIGDADLTFRFPRQWLTEWRDVAGAMERLAQQVRPGQDR